MLESRRGFVARAQLVALAIPLLAPVPFAGCGPSDPLEQVRVLQDEKGDFQGSIEPLRKLLETRPDDPEVNYRYGHAQVATGNPGLAVWSLEKAFESPDWVEKAGPMLASTRTAQGAYDEAVEICTRILEQKPDHMQALLLRATANMQSRRHYDLALADAERALELDPDQTDALSIRAVALLGLQRVDDAGKAIEELEGLFRDDGLDLHGSPTLCMARATFAAEKGEKELADKSYDACIERFPTDAIVLDGVIDYYDANGRPERSEEIVKHALELVPEAAYYRNVLALRLAAADKVEEAEAVLRAGIEVAQPAGAAEAWAVVGSFNVDHGDLDDAVAAYARAHELDKGADPELLLGYADALVLAKRFDEAAKIIDQIKVPAHRILLQGRLELARGNPAEALTLFDEGMRLWPNNAVARYSTAIAAERLGDFDRAIDEYRYAMRIDVTETDAYLRLARLQEGAGRYEGALSTLQFEPGARPEELAAALLELRLQARLLPEKEARKLIQGVLAEPEHRGAAVAALGEGIRHRSGPKASLAAMRAVPSVDLSDPINIDALAAIVEDLAATGKAKDGLALVETGLRKHSDSAALLAVRGRALQLSGAPTASVRESFEKALAIDAKNSRALVGLARVEVDAGSNEAALALYDRALAADANDAAAARESASVLVALGRSDQAEARLADLIAERAYDAAAARQLAELRLARGVKDDRTLELARRAVTFKGGAEAEALLEKIEPKTEQAGATPSSG